MNAEGLLGALLADSHMRGFDELPDLIAVHAARVGFCDPLIYLADLQQAVLRPVPGGSMAADESPAIHLGMESTLAGRAFRHGVLLEGPPGTNGDRPGGNGGDTDNPSSADEDSHCLWVPLLDGADRLGVLKLTAPAVDDTTRACAWQLAMFVALLIVNKRRHSDTYARLIRSREMNLAAEVQWTLMPSPSVVTKDLAISAVLEPAYAVGGDAFDFAFDGRLAHLCILDAMGHDLSSGLVASVALASYRNNRLGGAGLAQISEAVHAAVCDQFDQTRFITGILAELDTRTGQLSWVNRGHPPPLIIRQGRWIVELACRPTPPMGVDLAATPVVCSDQLEPGDRLLLYTDGIIEARSPHGEPFGLDRFIDFIIRREADALTTQETLRRLIHTIMDYQKDALRDDATVLLAEWRPGDGT
jgi:serine phosphatase RsbU (regulator of sigma subunit)